MKRYRTTGCLSPCSIRFCALRRGAPGAPGARRRGAYDRNELFNALEQRKILSGIKTRTDAATHSTGSPYRAECVRDRIRLGRYRLWAWITTYGMRWKIEGNFSSIKRIFGEGVRATSREGMSREIRMKVNAYNVLMATVA